MADVEPTPGWDDYHKIMVELAKETNLMAKTYAEGIDNIDVEKPEQSTLHLQNMNKLMSKAGEELERISP